MTVAGRLQWLTAAAACRDGTSGSAKTGQHGPPAGVRGGDAGGGGVAFGSVRIEREAGGAGAGHPRQPRAGERVEHLADHRRHLPRRSFKVVASLEGIGRKWSAVRAAPTPEDLGSRHCNARVHEQDRSAAETGDMRFGKDVPPPLAPRRAGEEAGGDVCTQFGSDRK